MVSTGYVAAGHQGVQCSQHLKSSGLPLNSMECVYFVRHGSTEGNEQGAYQHGHTPLSALGRHQAACVARRFERIPLEIVITSDMARAVETGRYIAARNRLPLVCDPLFQEILRPAIVRGHRRDAP